jgi:hypothetical protein
VCTLLLDHKWDLLPIFLKNLHSIFHSYSTILLSYQQCVRVPIFSHTHQHIIFKIFKIITILTGVRWYLIILLIFTFQIINVVEQLFTYLLVICTFIFQKYLFIFFCSFLLSYLVWGYLVEELAHIFWKLSPSHIYSLKIFSCSFVFWSWNESFALPCDLAMICWLAQSNRVS